MIKLKPAILAVLVLLLSGCGQKTPQTGKNTNPDTQGTTKVTDTQKQTTQNDKDKTNNNTSDNTSTAKPDTSGSKQGDTKPAPAPAQPAPRTGVKLNFDALDKLDNKKYSWWITMNKEHKTPTIPSDIKALIDKNDSFYVGDTSKKNIYLTFDEGYENGYTAKILDVLKANNVKSIFFVTSSYVKQNTELIKRMIDEGHQVGHHSVNHPSLPTVDNATLEKELLGLETQFAAQFNKGFKYMRPPMGEYSERTLAANKQMGYKTIFWSFAYMDWDVNNQKGPDNAYKMVMDNLHNGAILLLHAVSKDNAEALDRIIKDVRAQGYTISPMDL